jgi:A/G-specific adenine glycosylase
MLAGTERTLADAAAPLLAWYDRTRRDLPWRRNHEPYAVWVSEIMLQQTTVDVVVRHYEGFLARFPDVSSLAAASLEQVLAAWSGLGYYQRARNLHAGARLIAAAGEWPRDTATWRGLPGVGEYTAAAISSIAGGEAVAVLDGNVERVLSRLLASAGDPKRAATRRPLQETARSLLVPGRPGDSNQAMMELGATVCRPLKPRCAACPLTEDCAGWASGTPQAYPAPRRRRASEAVRRQVFIVAAHGRRLLFQRSAAAARLAGFWELPWVEGGGGAPALEEKYGGRWTVGRSHGRVRHTITNRRFEVEVHDARWQPAGPAEGGSARWCSPEQIATLATSSLVTKVLQRWRPLDAAEPSG